MKDLFVQKSVLKHPELSACIEAKNYNDADIEIENYFRVLLGEHYLE
jgi:hypothetical protein